jgi:hypothetical protein
VAFCNSVSVRGRGGVCVLVLPQWKCSTGRHSSPCLQVGLLLTSVCGPLLLAVCCCCCCVCQGEVLCLRNALVNKVAETEEALRAATAEYETASR